MKMRANTSNYGAMAAWIFALPLLFVAMPADAVLIQESERFICKLVALFVEYRILAMAIAIIALGGCFALPFVSGRIGWGRIIFIIIGIVGLSLSGAIVGYIVNINTCLGNTGSLF